MSKNGSPSSTANDLVSNSTINNNNNNNNNHNHLDVLHQPQFCKITKQIQSKLQKLPLYRPSYYSNRFQTQCVTPCYCSVYGGLENLKPFIAMPDFLVELKHEIETFLHLEKDFFNVVLVRCYLNGDDSIAWHTDAREFLGKPTVVASLSFGGERTFEMKKVAKLWSEINHDDTPSSSSLSSHNENNNVSSKLNSNNKRIRATAPTRQTNKHANINHSWQLKDGDLFVMKGLTQEYWHHRVAPDSSKKHLCNERWNVNFRRILKQDQAVAQRGVDTYYKYCRWGDGFDAVVKQNDHEKDKSLAMLHSEIIKQEKYAKPCYTGPVQKTLMQMFSKK